jgi:uncharacterized protein YjbI with pentapeptide repeats
LTFAHLRDGNLVQTDLTGANLSHADLTSADLTGANFDLHEAGRCALVSFDGLARRDASGDAIRIHGSSAWHIRR